MAFLGDLLIRLRAETADFQSDMGKAAYVAEKNMRQIQRAASTLFAIIGAGSFVAMVKGSIDAADKLNDLSKTTDISVEKLSGLRVAAKQSGGDLDSIAASVSKLSVNIGKDGDKFKALGITAKEPLEAFKQLADVFVSIQDPQLRAAVAAQALGKSWQGAVPLLAEGGKKIGEMVDRGSELSGVTKEMAEEADKFNDKLTELTGTGGLMIRLVGPMLPLLNSLAEDMLKASEKTDGLNSSIKPLAKTFKPLAETLKTVIILGANVSFVFETMGKDLSRLAENIKLIATGNFAGSRALGEMFRKDAEAARKALDEYEKKILGLGLTGNTVPTAPADGKNASAAAARARAFVDGADKKGKTDPYMTENENKMEALKKRQMAALQQMEEKKRNLFALTEEEIMLQRVQTGSYKDFDDATTVRLLNMSVELDQRKQTIDRIVEEYKSVGMLQTAFEEADEAQNNFAVTQGAFIRDQQFEIDLIGKTAYEQERLTSLRKIELARIEAIKNLDRETQGVQIQAINDQSDAIKNKLLPMMDERRQKERDWQLGAKSALDSYLDRVKNAAEQSNFFFTNAFKNMEDALVSFVKTGKLNFKSLADSIITDLIRIQIQKSVMPMLSSGLSFGAGFMSGVINPATQAPAPVVERSFATGTNYVPKTGLYQLHQGEAVLTAAENGQGGGIVFATTINIDSRTDAATIARTVDGAMRQSEARQIALLNQGGGAMYHAVRRA